MTTFIQIHALTSYPPSNLNRDDLGRPKTAIFGGSQRLRISSQCLKRTWRTGDTYETAMADHLGIRTKNYGCKIFDRFLENGIDRKTALEWAHLMLEQFGKPKTSSADLKKQLKTLDFDSDDVTAEHALLSVKQLIHLSPKEQTQIMIAIDRIAKENRKPKKNDVGLRNDHQTADIAMFGRMIASSPKFNMDAAVQVAHAITIHKVDVEDDFFSAVDDLNTDADSGAAHLGDLGFGAGVYYLYACINFDLLLANLQNDEKFAIKSVNSLLESILTESPTGKQNSFGSRAYANYALVEIGTFQPRNLSIAFLNPRNTRVDMKKEIEKLQETRERIDRIYSVFSQSAELNILDNDSKSLKELQDFIQSEVI